MPAAGAACELNGNVDVVCVCAHVCLYVCLHVQRFSFMAKAWTMTRGA